MLTCKVSPITQSHQSSFITHQSSITHHLSLITFSLHFWGVVVVTYFKLDAREKREMALISLIFGQPQFSIISLLQSQFPESVLVAKSVREAPLKRSPDLFRHCPNSDCTPPPPAPQREPSPWMGWNQKEQFSRPPSRERMKKYLCKTQQA